MKTIMLILFLILPTLAGPQKAVKPFSLTVRAAPGDLNDATASAIRAEFRKSRDVKLKQGPAEYAVCINAAPAACGGYAVAVEVIRSNGDTCLDVFTGPTVEKIAAVIVARIRKQHFTQ